MLRVIALVLIGCASPPRAPHPPRYVTDAKGVFTFETPSPATALKARGIDSLIGRYQVGACELRFDAGDYSNGLEPWTLAWPANYRQRVTGLSGIAARWARWSYDDGEHRHRVGVHVPYLTVIGACDDEKDVAGMTSVLETIRLLRPQDPPDHHEILPHGTAAWRTVDDHCRASPRGTGRLEVRVVDEQGRPAEGVFVMATLEHNELTNADGIVLFDGVPDGEYDLVATRSLTREVDGITTISVGVTESGAVCRGQRPDRRVELQLARY